MTPLEDDYDGGFDDNEITDCPSCGQTYDDADADFLICSKCGYDAEKKNYKASRIDRGMSGYGIDPDVTHRITQYL
jgi:tRNA(Ile2) C34 agmatinyltransferase TiaS